MNKDEIYIKRCLQLAEAGAGFVAPNPMVGAVLVHNNIIIGEGYHKMYGEAHAEVNCINSVPSIKKYLIKESTLYVSLEPCNHFGNTPPCTDLIIRYAIPKVVIGCSDPFEKVNGAGIEKLSAAGVEVIKDVLKEQAVDLNKRFFTFQKSKRPYIILKWAQSENLKIAHENSKPVKISNEITDRLVHKWRSEEAAIMVGTNTALIDNPSLTTRLWPGTNPVRIIVDADLKLPSSWQVFDNQAFTVVLNHAINEEKNKTLFYQYAADEDLPIATLAALNKLNLTSLLIEGGTKLLQSFIDKGLWDEARVITNRHLHIDNGISAPVLQNGAIEKRISILSDEITYYKISTVYRSI